MKRMFVWSLFSLAFVGFSAHAVDLTLTPKIKRILCARMQRAIPTEDGKAISIVDCLRGQFEQTDVRRDRFVLEWQAQTVEDVTTVCEVEYAKKPADISRLHPATCEMQ
jgi:hypothetical protein